MPVRVWHRPLVVALALTGLLAWCPAASAQDPAAHTRPDHPLGRGGFSRHRHAGRGHSGRAAVAVRHAGQLLRGVPRKRSLSAGHARPPPCTTTSPGSSRAGASTPSSRTRPPRCSSPSIIGRPCFPARPSCSSAGSAAGRGHPAHGRGRHRPGQRRRVRRHAGARAEAAPDRAQGARRARKRRTSTATRRACGAALEPFSQRVELTYVPQQSLPGLLAAVKAVPANSLILFTRYIPDGVRQPHATPTRCCAAWRRCRRCRSTATTDLYIGTGVVGGMMRSSRATGLRLGAIARRILDGAPPERIPLESCGWCRRSTGASCGAGTSTSSALPPGSDIRFVTPTVWEEYRSLHHRHAGGGRRASGAHHRTAHPAGAATPRRTDDPRPRGDAAQQLRTDPPDGRPADPRAGSRAGERRPGSARRRVPAARLRVDGRQHAEELSPDSSRTGRRRRRWRRSRRDTQNVFEGLRRLSHDLHPATLRLLGLAAALRTHCVEMAKHHGVEVAFKADAVPATRPQGRRGVLLPDRAGGAAERDRPWRRPPPVRVADGRRGTSWTSRVTDDGAGFDVTSTYRNGGGLGLVTMNERARVVGATVDIASHPARGTTVHGPGAGGACRPPAVAEAPASAGTRHPAHIT